MSKTNHVRLIGNIGSNPELIATQNNGSVLSFTLATHESVKNAEGQKENRTDWHKVVAFGNVANLIHKFTGKGSQVMIIGRLSTRQYTDKQNNQRYTTEIITEEVLFLGNSGVNPANKVVPE
jgi:single-strand DNA-binding protein